PEPNSKPAPRHTDRPVAAAMALFLSTSIHKIDKKGRVSVPAAFRAALEGETFRGVALTPPLDGAPCIEGAGMSRVEQIAQAIETMNPFAPERDMLATAVLAEMQPASFDGEGRIVLPEAMIAYAGLTDRALFAGLGSKFQIWQPEQFEERKVSAKSLARNSASSLPWAGAPRRADDKPKE
ncbi:MAG: hypothetical protein MRY74_01910, partial [Neomegalonema sp.]|nr:hypothetical protein [Neomegalonema sp.]